MVRLAITIAIILEHGRPVLDVFIGSYKNIGNLKLRNFARGAAGAHIIQSENLWYQSTRLSMVNRLVPSIPLQHENVTSY